MSDEEEAPAAARKHRKHKCRYGDDCRMRDKPAHCKRFWHPSDPPEEERPARRDRHRDIPEGELSQEGDQHAGTKFPRMQCKSHPGCRNRWTCWYSHGLIHSAADDEYVCGSATCFLGQPPHNQGCMNPTWNGDPFDFCSRECRDMAKLTPKGPLGCRRENCPCPVTVNGMAGQFCCKTCYEGKPCRYPAHVVPTAHLVIVAKPQAGKYSPCVREGCACAVEGGSSWDGKPGQYCCRACRNGTPCTKLWHTEPENERAASAHGAYVGFTCAMEGCDNAPWNGCEGEYCCLEHRHMAMGNYVPPEDEEPAADKLVTEGQELLRQMSAKRPKVLPFPNFGELWRHAAGWARSHSSGAQKGKIAKVWFNESLTCVGCPARRQFEKAVQQSGCGDFRKGEFGWHGTKSIEAINGICWSNLDTARRSGQAYGPGEYFSRGTQAGLNYSEGYAGGTAGNLLIVFWIMSHELGAPPNDPSLNGAGISRTDGHIVCNNPTTSGNRSTGAMYCVPCAVVCFGSVSSKPNFRTFNPAMTDPDVDALLLKLDSLSSDKQAKECDKTYWRAQELMLAKSEALLKNALEGANVEALQAAITQVQQHCLVDTTLLEKAKQMLGPKCKEQIEAAMVPGANPEVVTHAVKVAEQLSGSGAPFVDKALLAKVKERLPVMRCEFQLKVALDSGDVAALKGGIRQATGVAGVDDVLYSEACQALVDISSEQLRTCMAGTDVAALQKAITQATTVEDSLPKKFDEEESKWMPVSGMPKIEEALLDEARKRLIAMKYENALRTVVQQAKTGSADLNKVLNALKQAQDVEGIDADLLGEARGMMIRQCDEALKTAARTGDFTHMVIAVSTCEGIPGVNADLLEKTKQRLPEMCVEKRKACEDSLVAAADASDCGSAFEAINSAEKLKQELQEACERCSVPESLHNELKELLTVDEALIKTARERRTVIVYQDSLALLAEKLQQGSVHVASFQLFLQQATIMPELATVSADSKEEAQQLIVSNCETKLRSACDGGDVGDVAALLAAISWSEGIEGVDSKLLDSARDLVAPKCDEMIAKVEEQLKAACAGIDASVLQSAMKAAEELTGMPSDPNRGFGPRVEVKQDRLQHGILQALNAKQAVPVRWQDDSNDGKPRIKADLLKEARKRLVLSPGVLEKARERLLVVEAESKLRSASDGDNLDVLMNTITRCEKISGFNEELLLGAKALIVKKAEEQLKAACDRGDIVPIQAMIKKASSIKGVSDNVLRQANESLVTVANTKLQAAIDANNADQLRLIISQVENVDGVDNALVQSARDQLSQLETKKGCCCVIS